MKDTTTIKLFFLVCVAFGAFLIYSDLKKPGRTDSSSQVKKPTFDQNTYEARVNKHLSETYNKINDKKAELKLEAAKGQMLGPSQQPVQQPYSVLGEGNEMGFSQPYTYTPESPGELIQTELYREQIEQAENERAKKEYARRYIEYAYEQGYEVVLDANYQVISVRPLSRLPARDR